MKESLREGIYQKIRDNITYGKLSPGERLIEGKLCKEFQTSRTPIREALRQLENEGLIIFERNKGITVSKLSVKQVEEIYNLRCLLESYAAGLCAKRVEKKQIFYLKGIQVKLKKAAKDFDLLSWLYNNTLFHDFFSEHCGNQNLTQILDALKRQIYRYKYIIVRIPGYFEAYLEQHESILRGVEKSDIKMAEKYMRIHLESIKNVLIDYLDKFPII